ncbi:S8 family serine peptidase [Pontiellaceae bacterium B12219]|nr:S8 family serine peptidase [Pontiellaceae bacterium B12219]
MNLSKLESVLLLFLVAGIASAARNESRFAQDVVRKEQFQEKLETRALQDREEVKRWAAQKGVPIRYRQGHQVVQLRSIVDGKPLYLTTLNKQAAISTATDQVQQISSGYGLDGDGIIIGIWDGGWVRSTHVEFGSRVSTKDTDSDSTGADLHATHVGGTLGASGVNAAAKGMAPAATIHSYGWETDLLEMAAAAANAPGQSTKIYISNHSYGILNSADYFGQYMIDVDDLDGLVYGNEYYLPFIAAGNDQDESSSGYDTIAYFGVAKNVMTIGAVYDAVSGSSRSLANAYMTGFSSWGPVDDGRIKPDIVANGYELESASAVSDAQYLKETWSGTSMATPNACGSAALLVELYKELFSGGAMRASTLKGLIIHTADDLGNPGPDYKYGWGLMNTWAAAELLSDYANGSVIKLTEAAVSTGESSASYEFQWNGVDPIRVTLCWTDPAGTVDSGSDDRVADLVNDLDLRVTGPGGTYYPYKLSYVSPSANATATGENNVDNVEQVYIESPLAGTYTVIIDYDGTLSGGSQWYSLLVSGDSGDSDDDGMPDSWESLYFSSLTGAVASADLDDDGSSNYSEYIAGTLPNNADSVFQITTHDFSSSSGTIINWSTVEGRVYSVSRTPNLQYIDFVEFPDAIDLPYTVNSYTDTVNHAQDRGYYRVDVKLAP